MKPRSVFKKVAAPKRLACRVNMGFNGFRLIGIYGKLNDRRALIRLSNSKYQVVDVGDVIESKFAVITIFVDRMRLVDIRNGEYFVVHMPS